MYVVDVRIHLPNKLIAYGIDLNPVSFAVVPAIQKLLIWKQESESSRAVQEVNFRNLLTRQKQSKSRRVGSHSFTETGINTLKGTVVTCYK